MNDNLKSKIAEVLAAKSRAAATASAANNSSTQANNIDNNIDINTRVMQSSKSNEIVLKNQDDIIGGGEYEETILFVGNLINQSSVNLAYSERIKEKLLKGGAIVQVEFEESGYCDLTEAFVKFKGCSRYATGFNASLNDYTEMLLTNIGTETTFNAKNYALHLSIAIGACITIQNDTLTLLFNTGWVSPNEGDERFSMVKAIDFDEFGVFERMLNLPLFGKAEGVDYQFKLKKVSLIG